MYILKICILLFYYYKSTVLIILLMYKILVSKHCIYIFYVLLKYERDIHMYMYMLYTLLFC